VSDVLPIPEATSGVVALLYTQGQPEFLFWFIFFLNVGLFLAIIILLRFAYPTYATCPFHNTQLKYVVATDQYYCEQCRGYVSNPREVKR
jgi:hypothetical protein